MAVVLPSLELGKLHRDDLEPEEREGVRPVAALVGAGGRDDAGLEPEDLRGRLRDRARRGEDLGRDAAGGAEHGPPAVDDLGVGEPLGVDERARSLGVGEAQRVEAVVGGESAVEVAGFLFLFLFLFFFGKRGRELKGEVEVEVEVEVERGPRLLLN